MGFASIQLPHDKWIHYCTFLILSLEFYFIFDTQNKNVKTVRSLTVIICTVSGSVGLEIVQSLVNPSRTFDIYDIASNVLGSLTAVGIAWGYQSWQIKKARNERLRYRKLHHVAQDLPETEDYVNIEMSDVPSP